jgi:DNA replication protein DnaC
MLPCPTCQGTEGYENARRRVAFQSLLADAQLPRNSETWDLDSYRACIGGEVEKVEALRIAAAFARGDLGRMDPPMRNLYLFGPLGTGKTGLGVSILRARLHQGQAGVYYTLPDLLDRIRRTFERSAGEASDDTDTLLRKLRDVDLLVLDDVGVERPTAWVLEKLFQILDGRMRGERETVFTSNLDMVALRAHLGERVTERVIYQTWDVEVGGRNLRYTSALAGITSRHANGAVR